MRLWSDSFKDGQPIPERCAFGKPAATGHVALSDNRNPHLAWSDLPAGTKSLVLICHDSDVPSKPDDVNQEGRTIPASLPRVDFTHWVLIELAPSPAPIAEGEFSGGITAHGKSGPVGPRGTRQGINDYTSWFSSDREMAGDYYGYDGPCPPWNDPILHHYHFTLYATDLERLSVPGKLARPDVLAAIAGHILAEACLTGTYSLNPNVKG
jgi:Raf kinase inhibitor-like YbhB/YbcL family protein